jgi:uncharacterized protein (DUF983 family)
MINKGTKLYSIIHQKCPHCQEGDLFLHGAFSTKFMQMHKTCPRCGFDFVQEPSFYFGAMYFSYAIQVAIFVMVYLVLRYTIDPGDWTYVKWMIVASFVVLPLNFRWSRLAWINLFARYDAKALEKSKTPL